MKTVRKNVMLVHIDSDQRYGMNGLTIYDGFDTEGILKTLEMVKSMPSDACPAAELAGKLDLCLGRLITFSEERGYRGNLIAAYTADMLVNAGNIYAVNNELNTETKESGIDAVVLHDMEVIRSILKIDMNEVLDSFKLEHLKCVLDYTPMSEGYVYAPEIRDLILALADELKGNIDELKGSDGARDMKDKVTGFYGKYGVGMLGLHKAFALTETDDGRPETLPVTNMTYVRFSDLAGYDIAKGKLIGNTEAFLNRRPANNCLLYGDAGTGKSSCIKALASEYYDRGLRIIQVARDQFKLLSGLISILKNRNYRFIIYMDDLSFEDFETDYKYLKAVIEGGLEQRPENVLIYATSNRRHIIKETVSDRNDRDEDMHRSDTMSEKLSLSQRFGMQIYFGSPDKESYNGIVKFLAKREGIDIPDDKLFLEANKWELSHGGRSGRVARQFVDHLLGSLEQG